MLGHPLQASSCCFVKVGSGLEHVSFQICYKASGHVLVVKRCGSSDDALVVGGGNGCPLLAGSFSFFPWNGQISQAGALLRSPRLKTVTLGAETSMCPGILNRLEAVRRLFGGINLDSDEAEEIFPGL